MPQNNPMFSINVKLWKYFSLIFPREGTHWRIFIPMLPICILNSMQYIYLFRMWGDLIQFTINTFLTIVTLDTLLRGWIVICQRYRFEAFILKMEAMYKEIEQTNDKYANKVLKEAVLAIRLVTILNSTAALLDIIGALLFPLLYEGRVHPFGVAFPGVDMTAFPVYEIVYIMQFSCLLFLSVIFFPFVNLFASFTMFGKTALKILQHKLHCVCEDNKTEEQQFIALKDCIVYYNGLVSYINELNSLMTYIIFLEFLLYQAILCTILFCLNIIEIFSQIISIILYTLTALYILFTYYWHANELLFESIKVSEAVYFISWYNCSKRFRKTLLLFLMRTQQPLQIMIGNIYPMTLASFQSLLNAAYSFFTMLRGLYQ